MNRTSVVALSSLLFACLGFAQAVAQQPIKSRVVLMIDHGPSGFVDKVNSKVVPRSAKSLLMTLSKLRDSEAAKPTDMPEMLLLVHERVSIRDIQAYLGAIYKAGYSARVFCFDRFKNGMFEVTFPGPEVPFSPTGDIGDKR